MTMQPHICIDENMIPPVVLACGDPKRAKDIADLMESPTEIAYNREYRTFVGNYDRQRIAVTSHGVGAAGAAICFEELIKVGVGAIIRLGTCGSLQEHLKQSDHILVTAAVREDGVSPLLVPVGYPAVASTEAIKALEDASRELGHTCEKGIVLSTDLFYPGIFACQPGALPKGRSTQCGNGVFRAVCHRKFAKNYHWGPAHCGRQSAKMGPGRLRSPWR